MLFIAAMLVVFGLGMLASSILNRRAEIASVFNNKKTEIIGIESRNELFADNYPREYQSWLQTADTTFRSKHNSSEAVDVLDERPKQH